MVAISCAVGDVGGSEAMVLEMVTMVEWDQEYFITNKLIDCDQ